MEVLARYGTPGAAGALAEAAAGRRDPLLLRHDRARRRVVGRHQHRKRASSATAIDYVHQRPQVVDLRRRRSALQDLPSSWARPTRTTPTAPAAVDDPGADGHARRHGPAHADGVRLRRRAARPRGGAVRERARAGVEHAAGRRPRLRDRAGPARAGTHPPLHAPDRPGRAGAGGDVPARADARGLRQAAGRAGRDDPSRHRRVADRDRAGAAADAEGRCTDGHRRQQGRAHRDRDDQGRRAEHGAAEVIDRAIQAHGGGGVSDDFGLADAWAMSRTLRLADGPDEVHREQLGKMELRKYR